MGRVGFRFKLARMEIHLPQEDLNSEVIENVAEVMWTIGPTHRIKE